MDAAQKLLKTSAILLAIALLTAAPGWAQPTLLAPSTVTIGSTTVSDPVSVTSSAAGTTEITYTIGAPDYSVDSTGSRTGWLNAPSGSTTTPSSLTFRVFTTAGVNSGASARITLTPTAPASAVGAPVTITVSFNGSGNPGGSITLTANPAGPISLAAAANGEVSTGVTITTSSVSSITISVTSSVVVAVTNWLSNSSINNSTISSAGGTTLTIDASAVSLPSGTYQGTVTITPSTGSPLSITVNFTVGTGVGNGLWTATPGSVAFNFTTNSQSYPSQQISLTAPSSATTYQVITTTTSGGSWLLGYLPSVS